MKCRNILTTIRAILAKVRQTYVMGKFHANISQDRANTKNISPILFCYYGCVCIRNKLEVHSL